MLRALHAADPQVWNPSALFVPKLSEGTLIHIFNLLNFSRDPAPCLLALMELSPIHELHDAHIFCFMSQNAFALLQKDYNMIMIPLGACVRRCTYWSALASFLVHTQVKQVWTQGRQRGGNAMLEPEAKRLAWRSPSFDPMRRGKGVSHYFMRLCCLNPLN